MVSMYCVRPGYRPTPAEIEDVAGQIAFSMKIPGQTLSSSSSFATSVPLRRKRYGSSSHPLPGSGFAIEEQNPSFPQRVDRNDPYAFRRTAHFREEELLERVWPGIFIEEGNLARHIFNLRQVLGDSPDGRKYIETIPRRGYRFVAA